jgi:hypothetical protein
VLVELVVHHLQMVQIRFFQLLHLLVVVMVEALVHLVVLAVAVAVMTH